MTVTDLAFYKGKKILLTGHTGFKGSWMSQVLLKAGADVTGYALDPPTTFSLFEQLNLKQEMRSVKGDVRDLAHMEALFASVRPEIVIHMAAQPIVRESYRKPVYTYETNVMGTVNVLECIRKTDSVQSVVNVTTDKVYRNMECRKGYQEDDYLDGYDPYSNSKSCSELVTSSYRNSFLREQGVAVSTMRAGNVIGGGDYAADRIVPDCVRAAREGKEIIVRNPASIRPFQHVLEPVMAYLLLAKQQWEEPQKAGSYNVGPDDVDCVTVRELVETFCSCWKEITKAAIKWRVQEDGGPHEAALLTLNCNKFQKTCGWYPRWHVRDALWECACFANRPNEQTVRDYLDMQITEFLTGGK